MLLLFGCPSVARRRSQDSRIVGLDLLELLLN
jgi:hypothetical protein